MKLFAEEILVTVEDLLYLDDSHDKGVGFLPMRIKFTDVEIVDAGCISVQFEEVTADDEESEGEGADGP
jgi:hypothetical protein